MQHRRKIDTQKKINTQKKNKRHRRENKKVNCIFSENLEKEDKINK